MSTFTKMGMKEIMATRTVDKSAFLSVEDEKVIEKSDKLMYQLSETKKEIRKLKKDLKQKEKTVANTLAAYWMLKPHRLRIMKSTRAAVKLWHEKCVMEESGIEIIGQARAMGKQAPLPIKDKGSSKRIGG